MSWEDGGGFGFVMGCGLGSLDVACLLALLSLCHVGIYIQHRSRSDGLGFFVASFVSVTIATLAVAEWRYKCLCSSKQSMSPARYT